MPDHVDTPAFNMLSLCAGTGGLDLGLQLAVPSARTVCYVEHEAYCCAVLAARMEEGWLDQAPVWSDLRTFDGKPWRGVVDCVIGGYPCQPFSCAGKRGGHEDPRHLWPCIARVVKQTQPTYCLFENVPGHLSLGFEAVVDDLQGMGYAVAASLFTASEVGAPHKRERLFILARNVGHPERLGRNWLHEREQPRHLEANAGITGKGSKANTTPGSGSTEVVAHGNRPGRIGGKEQNVGQEQGRGVAAPHRDDAERRDKVVVHSNGQRQPRGDAPVGEGKGGRVGTAHPGPSQGADDLPSWPPGPNDSEGWAAVLRSHKQVEPAVRGMAHGVASRVERLRACGNGVVPAVVKLAWDTLIEALEV